MLRRSILFLLMLGLVACAAPKPISIPDGMTLIILRHADRDDENLNAKGIARAQALVGALDGITIDAIYAPGIKRNLDTAAPLAMARALDIIRIPGEKPAQRLLAGNAGKTIVWVGNKGNLRSIWEAIQATEPAPLEYGDLFFVTRGPLGAPTVVRKKFGP